MPEAFVALYVANQAAIRRYMQRRLHTNREDTADLAADVWVRAWSGWARRDDRAPVLAWLFRIARNRLIDHVRARRAHPWPDAPFALAAAVPQPGDPLVRCVEADALRLPLAALTDAQRAVIALHFGADRTPLEISVLLGLSHEGVKKLQQRGLAALRRSFAADAAIAQAEDDLGCAALPRPHRHPRRLEARWSW